MADHVQLFLDFVRKSPSAFHAVKTLCAALDAGGFTPLSETQPWRVVPGGKYYVTRNLSSVVAFAVPQTGFAHFQIVSSHSDSPTFKLKHICEDETAGGCLRLNVERYGGMIMSSWFDRPLSIAGRVLVREGGHWQPLAASLPGLILGGSLACQGAPANKMNLEEALDSVMGVPLGGTLLRLGTLYLRGGAMRANASELFRILANDRGYSRHPGLTDHVLAEISSIAEGCRHAASDFASGAFPNVWAQEIVHMANLVDAACNRRDERRLRFLRAEHDQVWLLRNRPGGMQDSRDKLPRF